MIVRVPGGKKFEVVAAVGEDPTASEFLPVVLFVGGPIQEG